MSDAHWWMLFAAIACLLGDSPEIERYDAGSVASAMGKACALVLLSILLVSNIGTQHFLLSELLP